MKVLSIFCDLKSSIWYSHKILPMIKMINPAKLDKRRSQNVPDIRGSFKVYRENHEKLESQTHSWSKKISWGENPERNLPGRCVMTIMICNSDDVSQSHI